MPEDGHDRSPESAAESDAQLACRARDGCLVSFEELVRRYQVPLLRFVRRRVAVHDAEDLLQETFVRAWQQLHRYDPKWEFRTWLYTIARRLTANSLRDGAARMKAETRADPLPSVQSSFECVADEDWRRHVWGAAESVLTERQFTAVWLHYGEQMPSRDIARVLDCSRLAVLTLLFRARGKLAAALRPLLESAGGTQENVELRNPCEQHSEG